MATPSDQVKIYVKTTNAAPSGSDEIDGIYDPSWSKSRSSIETTDTKSGVDKTRILGLKDGSGTLGGDMEITDTIQGILRAAHDSGATVYVTFLWDGTNGYTVPALVESIDESSARDAAVSASFKLTKNGALIARP